MIFLKELEIEGYRSYGEKQVIDLATPGTVLVTGNNQDRGDSQAAGKSTIFKALQTALFQENDDGSIKDHGINVVQPKKGYYIGLSLDIDEVPHYIRYSRKHPEFGTDWGIWRWDETEWTDLRGKKFDDTKEVIKKLIGFTNSEFVSVAYIQQSAIAEFISCTPGEREEVFSNLMNLFSSEAFRKKTRDVIRNCKISMEKGREKVAYMQQSLDNLQYDLYNIEYPLTNQKLISLLSERIKSYSTILDYIGVFDIRQYLNKSVSVVLSNMNGRRFNLDVEIAEKQKSVELTIPYLQLVERLRMHEEDLRANMGEYSKLSEAYNNAVTEQAVTEAADAYQYLVDEQTRHNVLIRDLEKKIKKLEALGFVCSECDQSIPPEKKSASLANYKTELSRVRALYDSISTQVEPQKEVVRDLRKQYTKGLTAFGSISQNLKQRESINKRTAEDQGKMDSLKEVLGDAPILAAEETAEMQVVIQGLISEKEKLIEQRAQLENMIISVLGLCDKIEAAQADLDKVEKEIQEQQKAIVHLKSVDEILANFKMHKINSSRDLFNASLSYYLGLLTDGDIEAELVTEVAKADKKGTKLGPEILVSEGDKRGVSIRQYSGGEKTALSLAITGACWDLANSQCNKNINVLLLDEPFGMVDQYSEAKACLFLEYLKSLGRTVFVITNRNSVRDSGVFDRETRAVKKNHVTHLQHYDLRSEH